METDDAVSKLQDYFEKKGYRSERDLDLGLAGASLYLSKRVRWWLGAFRIHCYVFDLRTRDAISLTYVTGLHALARSNTDRCYRWSRWNRFRFPITVSLVLSDGRFDEELVADVRARKQRYQMGDVNTVILADVRHSEVHILQNVGFLMCNPLRRVHAIMRAALTSLDLTR